MDALKVYGQFRAYSGVFIAFVIGLSLVALGVYIVRTPPTYTNKTKGVANNVNCKPDKCTANVSVTISGNTYTPWLTYSSQISEKSPVDVYYDNSIPPLFSSSGDPPKFIGYIMISVALFCSIVAIIVASIVSQSNTAAKVYGGVTAVSDIGQLLK